MITRPAYCTRDDVLRASDVAGSLSQAREADRAVCQGADATDKLLNRVFYPVTATKRYRWPARSQQAPAWRLWIDGDAQLISLTTLSSGGVTIAPSSVFLEPQDTGPPYDRIELDISTATGFSVGTTPQRSIVITGTWGYAADTAAVGTLGASINSSVTTVQVSNSSTVGPGDLLYCGTEAMLVTDSAYVTTSQTLQSALTADSSVVSVSVTTGSSYAAGELVLLDSELMEITAVTGNTLTVNRAVQGTVLAAHTGSTIYAPRQLTVTRGYAGSTAASHTSGDALTRNLPPALVSSLNLAYALTALGEQAGGYARPAGSGSRTSPQPGAGLPGLESQAWDAFGRIVGPGVI